METPERVGTRLSLLIDWTNLILGQIAHRADLCLPLVLPPLEERQRREALTVVALGKPLAARATLDERAHRRIALPFQ
jgi:hypothetical protein